MRVARQPDSQAMTICPWAGGNCGLACDCVFAKCLRAVGRIAINNISAANRYANIIYDASNFGVAGLHSIWGGLPGAFDQTARDKGARE